MKSVFDSIISRFNRTKEGISALEDRSGETPQAEMQRGKKKSEKTTHKTSKHPMTMGPFQKVYTLLECQKEKKRERENGGEIFELMSSTLQN